MRLVLVQNRDELAGYQHDIRNCAAFIRPKYSSQVLDALLEWYESFASQRSASFAAKRGINFLGRASALQSLFFLLVYDGGELVAFAPFFRFEVCFADSSSRYEVVAFSPDSTIFFYNDIMVKEGLEAPVVRTILDFFKNYQKTGPFIVLFNHVPSCSSALPHILQHAMALPGQVFNVSVSPLCWRGGLYPWNMNKLLGVLRDALENDALDPDTRAQLAPVVDRMAASNKTMLVFKKNHLPLKSTLYRIFGASSPSDQLFDLYNAVESLFQTRPVKYPYVALPESEEAFVDSLSSSKRYYFRRYLKQFEAGGGSFEKLPADAVTDRDIDDFISLHRERWGSGSNILNPMTSSFVFGFLQKMARNGLLTLFFAAHQSKRVASLCCIDFQERREFFSSGRSLEGEKLRVGKLLLYRSLIDSIGDGFRYFDFGYGDEAYKSDYDWSYMTNSVVALAYQAQPGHLSSIFPLYEEVMF